MFELLKSRRSIRKYEDRQLEKEKIDTLLKSALLAPSSMGKRPWEFIAVTDMELLVKLSQSKQFGSQLLKGAPFGIVVIADKEVSDAWIEDTSIAAVIIQLTAQTMGLGSCWVQIRGRMHNDEKSSEEYVKTLLNIPERYSVECIISLGYPAEEKKPYEEKDLLYNKLHFNSYNKEQ